MKNDNKDAEAIARLAKYQNVKFWLVPEPQVLSLRMMARECFAISDTLTEIKNRVCTDLYLLFPGFTGIFFNPFAKTALAILKEYPSPEAIREADREHLTTLLISKSARTEHKWASDKVDALMEISSFLMPCLSNFLF